jgi:hypothetical protein
MPLPDGVYTTARTPAQPGILGDIDEYITNKELSVS